jgi:hypothetical protein
MAQLGRSLQNARSSRLEVEVAGRGDAVMAWDLQGVQAVRWAADPLVPRETRNLGGGRGADLGIDSVGNAFIAWALG